MNDNAASHSVASFQSQLPAACEQWSTERLLKLNVDSGIVNVYSENLIFRLICSRVLNVRLKIFSALLCIYNVIY